MIGKLTGKLEYRATDHVLVDMHGTGFIVLCSNRTLTALPDSGETVSLYTNMIVREDMIRLYGFLSLEAKEWHKLLSSVGGVGPKASLAILDTLDPDELSRSIAMDNWTAIKAAKGIGPRTAKKIVLDLKDKLPEMIAIYGQKPMDGNLASNGLAESIPPTSCSGEVLSALTNLGFNQSEAAQAVTKASENPLELTQAELIREALKILGSKKTR